ncbi:MAG: hypothetical protein PHE67_12085 [Campylobacterales bacterium]|nr:hypothetical protein [Campylobacterales bacterium]
MEKITVTIELGIYKQPRYGVKIETNGRHACGFSSDDAHFLKFYFQRHLENIESVEFFANCADVPSEMLANIKEMKEILGDKAA